MRRPSLPVVLVVVLTIAGAVLRFVGLEHGLPHWGTRPDEREVLDCTLGFPQGDLNPRWFIYPTFYFHLIWLWDEAVLAVWRLWRERPDYATLLQTNLAPLLLAGRTNTAAMGVLMIPVGWTIARRMAGTTCGLVAATLLTTCYLLVRDSHALKPDVPLALGVLVSVWLLARYAETPTRRLAWLAGLAIGLTTAIKYNAILLLVVAIVADWISEAPRARPGLPRGTTLLLGVVAVGSFLALCPFLVTDWERTWKFFLIANWNVYVTRPESLPAPEAGLLERAWLFVTTRSFGYHLTFSLRHGCGLATALATPVALVWASRRRAHPMLRLSAFFVVFYFLVAGASPVRLARYLTPVVPLLLVAIADVVARLCVTVPRGAYRALAAAVLTGVLVAEPLGLSIGFDRVARETDTRVLATRWFADRRSPAVVSFVGNGPFAMAEPVLLPPATELGLRPDPRAFAQSGITHVVTLWHHDLAFFTKGVVEDLGPLASQLRLVAEFSPFVGPPAGVFEREDAFYVPFYGFGGVARPGPLVRIYAAAGVP